MWRVSVYRNCMQNIIPEVDTRARDRKPSMPGRAPFAMLARIRRLHPGFVRVTSLKIYQLTAPGHLDHSRHLLRRARDPGFKNRYPNHWISRAAENKQIMKQKIYIETSVVSYLTARLSKNIVVAAHQASTSDFWSHLHDYGSICLGYRYPRGIERG
uniref:Uncharacterized protein n=1 Tax=Candidatus Kentrum sp. SD TaxID=2126332 RepID=A0A451BJ44_9GAMM|nr:MAG: hypothetical protein BECKSD772F_GA0070984_101038 [Candidatus Kentron sp. SD]VFK41209.1 MAG: hypothetical protein BECKSD772E_GA0070983_101036 [Candidatus Kentron sp. SD]VFK78301.1 MAG: hypothetical protein BECKSD772D_GA0070982_101132 [Candidatus Kentron sp. SD]